MSNADELIDVLNKLDEAVLGGELDTQIEIASELVRARFKKYTSITQNKKIHLM